MAYNYSKLTGRIAEKLGTQSKFANAMGLSERTMSLKMSGKVAWKQTEISRACNILEISCVDIPAYFFTLEV